MALIEVGHAAQTFQLAATDRGMNTWLTGALNETSIEPLLMFDNPSEHVLFSSHVAIATEMRHLVP